MIQFTTFASLQFIRSKDDDVLDGGLRAHNRARAEGWAQEVRLHGCATTVLRDEERGYKEAKWAIEHGCRAILTPTAPFGDKSPAHPDFDGLLDIVHTSRGARMAAAHEEKLQQYRSVMQENLVKNIEAGLRLGASDIGRGERLRTALWHRVRGFLERYDAILTPTVAVSPFPVETWYPATVDGRPMRDYVEWVLQTYAFTVVGWGKHRR